MNEWILQAVRDAIFNRDYNRAIDYATRFLEITSGFDEPTNQVEQKILGLKEYTLLHERLKGTNDAEVVRTVF